MAYDDIVVGSGLSALGTVLGLSAQKRVLVIAGPVRAQTRYYDSTSAVPCAHVGFGGLGNFWHGVIPTGWHTNFAASSAADFSRLLEYFYPGLNASPRLGKPFLFVPWKPIRPAHAWARLKNERGPRLEFVHRTAERLDLAMGGVAVHTSEGVLRATRAWICSGALQTAGLLDRSLGRRISRAAVSDHILSYLGQIDRRSHPDVGPLPVERTRHGAWFQAAYAIGETALITRRPAHFGYRRLDAGIEQRAVFGLPTGGAIAKIVRAASPGLLAEALYNRAGLFPMARFQSVYAMQVVEGAHWLREGGSSVVMRQDVIRAATDTLRGAYVPVELTLSARPDMFLPMIHLHDSLDRQSVEEAGLNTAGSPVRIMDASIRNQIGPEHHSFKIMVAAFASAQADQ